MPPVEHLLANASIPGRDCASRAVHSSIHRPQKQLFAQDFLCAPLVSRVMIVQCPLLFISLIYVEASKWMLGPRWNR